jgi:hypothetical protein
LRILVATVQKVQNDVLGNNSFSAFINIHTTTVTVRKIMSAGSVVVDGVEFVKNESRGYFFKARIGAA